jgi:hypothetical protein
MAADDPDGAESQLHEVMGQWSQEGFHVQHLNSLFGQAQIDIYRRRGTAAFNTVDRQWPALKRSLLLRIQQVRVVLRHVYARAALTSGNRSQAGRALLQN